MFALAFEAIQELGNIKLLLSYGFRSSWLHIYILKIEREVKRYRYAVGVFQDRIGG